MLKGFYLWLLTGCIYLGGSAAAATPGVAGFSPSGILDKSVLASKGGVARGPNEVSMLYWMNGMTVAKAAPGDHDYEGASARLDALLKAEGDIKPMDYFKALSGLCSLYYLQEDDNAINDLLIRESESESAKPASEDGKVRQGIISIYQSMLILHLNKPEDALAWAKRGKLLLSNASTELPLQVALHAAIGYAQIALNNLYGAEETFKRPLELSAMALGMKKAGKDMPALDRSEATMDFLWSAYAGVSVLDAYVKAQGYGVAIQPQVGLYKVRKAASDMEKAGGNSLPGLPEVLGAVAVALFEGREFGKAQKEMDRVVEVSAKQKAGSYIPFEVMRFAAARSARDGKLEISAARFAQQLPLYRQFDLPAAPLVKAAGTVSDIIGNADWTATKRFQRMILDESQKLSPSHPGAAAPFLNGFAESARSLQQVDDAIAYYRELIQGQSSTPNSVEHISALHRLARYLREQKKEAESLEASIRLIESLRARYGNDSRVADAITEQAAYLRTIKRDDEAAKLEVEADAIRQKVATKQ